MGLSTIHWEEIKSVCNSSCFVLLSRKSTGFSPGSARLVMPQFFQDSQLVLQPRGALTLSHWDIDRAGLPWAKGRSFGRVPGTAVSRWQQRLAALSLEKDDGIQSGRCQDRGPGRPRGGRPCRAAGSLSHGGAAGLPAELQPELQPCLQPGAKAW